MFGAKRLFLIGLAVFTLASIGCSLARSPGQLIFARVIQGVGGATLTPQTLSIITNIFPPARRGAAFGIWGAVAGVASVTGPTLGGFLVTNYSWQAVFWVNVPVGIVAFALGIWLLPGIRLGRDQDLDLAGLLLATASLFAVVFGLIEGQRYHWGPISEVATFDAAGGHWGLVSIPSLFIASIILLVLFVLWDRRQPQPLVPFSLLSNRNYTIGNGLAAIVSFGMMGLFLPLTIFLQSVLGFSALKAGLTIAPMPLTSMMIAPLSGRATDRFGGKYILMAGLTFFGVGMGLTVWLSSLSANEFTFLPSLVLAGIGLGCTFAPMTTVTMQQVNPRLAGAASGLLNSTRQLGGAFGSAVVGAVLQNRLASELVSQAQAQSGNLPAAFRAQFLQGFARAANGALEVGRGQFGGSLPANLPPPVRARALQVAHEIFGQAFINAMRPSLVVPIAVLLFGALLTTALDGRTTQSVARVAEAAPAAG
jgi:EmrB/QacA subfamily drug resistance transporter